MESVGNRGILLKGQHTFHSQLLTPDSGGGSAKWTKVTGGESGICGSREGAMETAVRILVLSHSPTQQSPSFLSGALPSMQHQPGGQAIAPPSGLPLAPRAELRPC